ncbi:hypothetical protein LEP1GSC034_1360 [Leptospira interrogans str. 2003000735]|uniref:Uncharacterized protein n=1 Tax=Leptospira interrogans str. 2002000626 TaxID=996803 RepID=A0A829D1X6_LEPIR|nr:hypothetical protein LEP1GSC025_1519 [Leptospira interrogans str. 2002000621]EMJ70448.1 hypothetical protein LEP1GSC033_2129 [Leptospira interrogans str. 2002000632]EMJ73652.1 hypothetical protein LEP1GSC034_1360 [Leptospira interrogans str. 2003000735]EMJ84802.1 hypothetical protein LEP1GSC032_0969 [Leptospira interrogans str. 2002000631]EMY02909.1 hypothetical protein LEP1GSC029_3907 [Leptospira interrogans str. 2002000626]
MVRVLTFSKLNCKFSETKLARNSKKTTCQSAFTEKLQNPCVILLLLLLPLPEPVL